MQWENVYVFISSTFNDMHAERDYLVKKVFPQLSAWCEERKLRLIDIDLRWGVSEADATENKRVVQVCLDRIDACRPFFLCFLGQRRGWVPQKDDIGSETYDLFRRLEQAGYAGNASVTEMEILHALVDPLHGGLRHSKDRGATEMLPVEHAFFYLRQPDYIAELPQAVRPIYTNEAEQDPAKADAELQRWREEVIPGTGRPYAAYTASWEQKEKTPEIAWPYAVPTTAPVGSSQWQAACRKWAAQWAAAGISVRADGTIAEGAELQKAKEYNDMLTAGRLSAFSSGGAELADLILEQMKEAITARFGNREQQKETMLQKELDQQAQFLRIASDGFIERAGDFDAIESYLSSNETRPFALTAYAGMGKTSLLAHFVDTCQMQENETLHYRFVGASDDSVSVERLLRSLLLEWKECGKIKGNIPTSAADLIQKLPNFLAEAGEAGKTVIVIDAINQLASGMRDTGWIPASLPANVKLILSFKRGVGDADDYYRMQQENGAMVLHSVSPFEDAGDRKKLVNAYLSQYFKELDAERIDALVGSQGAGNPLFLKTVLGELRVFGSYQNLTELIKSQFGQTPQTAFDAVLQRMENDPAYSSLSPAVLLPHLFGWLAHSRYGLSVEELVGLLMREGLTQSEQDAYDAVYLVLRQLRPYLARRDGRIDFFYESFQIAAVNRYTGQHAYARTEREWHRSLAQYFEMVPFTDQHKLMEQVYQFAHAGMEQELGRLLCTYRFLEARARLTDASALVDDFAFAGETKLSQERKNVLELIGEAVGMSLPALMLDAAQFATHLWARLYRFKEPQIKVLLDEMAAAKKEDKEVWLHFSQTGMAKPGGSLIRSYRSSCPPFITADKTKMLVSVSTGQSQVVQLVDLHTLDVLGTYPIRDASFLSMNDDSSLIAYAAYNKKETWLMDTKTKTAWMLGEGPARPEHLIFYNRLLIVVSLPTMSGTQAADKRIKVWNLDARELVFEIAELSSSRLFAFNKKHGFIMVTCMPQEDADKDSITKIWDVRTGECIKTLDTQEDTHVKYMPQRIAFSRSEEKIYMVIARWVVAYDVQTWECINKYEITNHQTKNLVVSHNDRYFAYDGGTFENGNHQYFFYVYDKQERREMLIQMPGLHTYKAKGYSFTGGGETILFQEDANTISEYSVADGQKLGSHTGQADAPEQMFLADGDRRIVTYSRDDFTQGYHVTRVFDRSVNDGIEENTIGEVTNIIWYGDECHILTHAKTKTLWRLEWDTLQVKPVYDMQKSTTLSGMMLSPHGSVLGIEGGADTGSGFDWMFTNTGSWDKQYVLRAVNEYGGRNFYGMKPMSFCGNDHTVIHTERGGAVFVRDIRTGEVLRKIDSKISRVVAFGLMENASKVITMGLLENVKLEDESRNKIELHYDGAESRLKLWDITTGEMLSDFGGCTDNVTAGALSPDEKTLVVQYLRNRLEVFDVVERRKAYGVELPIVQRCELVFLRDDILLVYAESELFVLDVKSGYTLLHLVHEGRYSKMLTGREGDKVAFIVNAAQELGRLENLDEAVARVRALPDKRIAVQPNSVERDTQARATAGSEFGKKYYAEKKYGEAAKHYAVAVQAYGQLLEIKRTVERLHWAAHLETMAGVCNTFAKQPELAMPFYNAAVLHYEELCAADPERYEVDLGVAYSNLGDQYAMKNVGQAIEYYQKSLAIREKYKDADEQKMRQYEQTKKRLEGVVANLR